MLICFKNISFSNTLNRFKIVNFDTIRGTPRPRTPWVGVIAFWWPVVPTPNQNPAYATVYNSKKLEYQPSFVFLCSFWLVCWPRPRSDDSVLFFCSDDFAAIIKNPTLEIIQACNSHSIYEGKYFNVVIKPREQYQRTYSFHYAGIKKQEIWRCKNDFLCNRNADCYLRYEGLTTTQLWE